MGLSAIVFIIMKSRINPQCTFPQHPVSPCASPSTRSTSLFNREPVERLTAFGTYKLPVRLRYNREHLSNGSRPSVPTTKAFTIVELIITVTIMAALLVLAVVNLRSSQANGRDAERKADIESIAMHLETYYKSGTDDSTAVGDYPSTVLASSGEIYMEQVLRDIDAESISAPSITDPALTFIPATNNTQTAVGVLPQPTIDQYVYQPLQSTGALCTAEVQECRKFNLYYRAEADDTVYTVTSINQ